MRNKYFLFFVLTIAGCNNSEKSVDINRFSQSGEYTDQDSTVISNPLIDITRVSFKNTNDSIISEISVRSIPDSITFNNPKVIKGVNEFEWSLMLDIQNDSSFGNNITASIRYNNLFNDKKGFIRTSFNEFLSYCEISVSVSSKNPLEIVCYEILDVSVFKSVISMRFAKKDLPGSLIINFDVPWCVETSFNNPIKQSTTAFEHDFFSLTPNNFFPYKF